MDENKRNYVKQNKRTVGIAFAIVLLLLVPLIAMMFTDEVKWGALDFVVAAILLSGTGFLCEFVLRKVNKVKYRIVICTVLVATLLIIWAELAIGIIG